MNLNLMDDLDDLADLEDLAMLSQLLEDVEKLERKKTRKTYSHDFLDHYELMDEAKVKKLFRFTRAQIDELVDTVFFPGEDRDTPIRFGPEYKGTGSCTADKLLATLIFLFRMAHAVSMDVIGERFCVSRQYVGEVFHFMLEHLLRQHAWLLRLPAHLHTPALMEQYAEAYIRRGSPVKGNVQARIFAALDGTFVETLRPLESQRAVYTGYKRKHGLNFIGAVLPSGLANAVLGPLPGRFNDPLSVNRLRLLDQMAEHHDVFGSSAVGGRRYVFVADGIFGVHDYMFPIVALQPAQDEQEATVVRQFNAQLSRVRCSIEHFFGIVVNQFKGVFLRYNNRIVMDAVADRYRAACLLCNIQLCMNRTNQITAEFGAQDLVPTLLQYLYPAEPTTLYNPIADFNPHEED